MNPTNVYNPFCTPTYNSNGQINCANSPLPILCPPSQYSLCPYNPYLSNTSEGCVSTAVCTFTDKCKEKEKEGFCCNAYNVDCVDGCYTTKVNIDWIAPLVFFSGLTGNIAAEDLIMTLYFQTINNDPEVLQNTCPADCCSVTSTSSSYKSCCCPGLPCGCCCYPTASQSSEIQTLTFSGPDTAGVCGSLQIPDDDTNPPETISIITPLNSCCPNPCTDQIQVRINVQLDGGVLGLSSPIGTLTTTSGQVAIELAVSSNINAINNAGAILTLYYTYTCVCNQPTWTIYNAKLIFEPNLEVT